MITSLAERRTQSTEAATTARTARAEEASVNLNLGQGLDSDDYLYRRLTSGAKFLTRDLSPLSFDRQLEVAWYLFEQNPFAHRLIGLMTDLIIGEGVNVQVLADDNRIQEVVDKFMARNQLGAKFREFYTANSLNGELIFPVGVNEFSGIPVLGYLDSAQVKAVVPMTDNVLVLDKLVIKGTSALDERTLNIIREDPVTGRLTGDIFYHRINALPNSLRGRSDLMPLADWLDLYDQFMFAEVERLNLISAFAWDYKIEDADDKQIADKLKKLPKLKPGAVFAHNQKEDLQPRTPDLKAQDRSEVAHLLRVHIAGSMGFPVSYLGDVDSNRATIEGQNDVLLKTPSARQKDFAGLIDKLIRFAIEQATGKNPALFRDSNPMYRITMPEIAAKDIARVGTVMASVMSAMDTGINNETVSRKLATRVIAALMKHLGIDVDPQAVADEVAEEKDERQAIADELQAAMANKTPNPNAPIPPDPTADE